MQPVKCLCGSANCSGYMGGRQSDKLDSDPNKNIVSQDDARSAPCTAHHLHLFTACCKAGWCTGAHFIQLHVSKLSAGQFPPQKAAVTDL